MWYKHEYKEPARQPFPCFLSDPLRLFRIFILFNNQLEAIASRLEAIVSRLEAVASRLEAIVSRMEAIASRFRSSQTFSLFAHHCTSIPNSVVCCKCMQTDSAAPDASSWEVDFTNIFLDDPSSWVPWDPSRPLASADLVGITCPAVALSGNAPAQLWQGLV